MKLNVGYIPYLNMVPFHNGWAPHSLPTAAVHNLTNAVEYEFQKLSPKRIGDAARAGELDAAALSLVDYLDLKDRFQPLGRFGIALKGPAQSVLFFSKKPLTEFSGVVAVTNETATSVELLRILLKDRFKRPDATLGLISSISVFDGEADGVLLIGDEALACKESGLKGFPIQTDLGTEWLLWQGAPFVFAVWAARRDLPSFAHYDLVNRLADSLTLHRQKINSAPADHRAYWEGFEYERSSAHESVIHQFDVLRQKWIAGVPNAG